MQARKRMAAAVAVIASLGLALVGCSGNGEPSPTKPPSSSPTRPASAFVGKSLQDAFAHSPGSVTSMDAVKELGLRPASPAPASRTTVIAACYYNDTQVNVVVIPSTSVTEKIRDDARRGKYDSLLTDCRK
ncbi:hypothetical protein LK09_15235 [Microbacterium mangrovi]|uniref:Lipoprotein n=2 Tax=Microbacterium mangrovi TaxID=1348253 RepID=A0A0B1ZYR9_9MICO|nr:hypothetical protein LK09_15235 [Microbacterium mangrovi]